MSQPTQLTSGPVTGQLLRLSGPLLLLNLLQQLFNIMNSVLVSRFLGETAFAALGVADSVMNLYLFVLTGACLGTSILAARYYGEGNLPGLRQEIYTGAVLLGGFTLVAVAAGLVFLPTILRLIRTPAELMEPVSQYLSIILCGMVFSFLYNYLAAILRAVGNTRVALYILFVSLGFNLAAAWLMITRTQLGVRGPALATAVSQALAAGFCFAYICFRQPFLRPRQADMRLCAPMVRQTASFSSVSALHQSSLFLGKLLVQSFVNDLGTAAISAFTAASRVENFAQAIANSGSESVAIFVAQNQGSGQDRRAREGFHRSLALMVAIGVMVGLVLCLFPQPLAALFLAGNGGQSLSLSLCVSYLFRIGFFYPLSFSGGAFVGYFRGDGRMNIPFLASTTQISIRVAGTWLLVGSMGLDAVAMATGFGWAVVNLFHPTCYYLECKGIWVKKQPPAAAKDAGS